MERWFRGFKLEFQLRRVYKGKKKIMDIYIAERKLGGKRYVIDCKHYPIAYLDPGEVDSTLEYIKGLRVGVI